MQELRLTPISYIVLGLLSWAGDATPYRLKQLVAASVGNFWTLQHAQLYTEPERLAKAGYLTEQRERGGRRRKLAEYEQIRDTMPESVPRGPRLALDAGIASERHEIEWWEAVKVSPDGYRSRAPAR